MDLRLYEKYKAELSEELDLTDFNVKEVQLHLPAIKHKWVAILIDHKIELSKAKQYKQDAIELVIENLRQNQNFILSDAAFAKQAAKHEKIKKITAKIEELEILILYLEKVEKVCSSTTFDIKNLVEIKKLEIT